MGLLLVVLAVEPEMVSSTVYAKYKWFYIFIGLTVFATIFITLKKYYLTLCKIDIILFIFISYIVTHFYVSESVAMTRFSLLILLSISYLCFRILFSYKPSSVNYMLIILIITAIIESLWGMLQLYGLANSYNPNFKITGSFFNPGPFGGYLSIIFPISLSHIFIHLKKNAKFSKFIIIITFISIVISVLVIPASMSRAAWLSLCIGGLYVIVDRFELFRKISDYLKRQKTIKSAIIITGFMLLLSIIFIPMYYLKQGSADSRMVTWKASASYLLKKGGIKGIGLGHFPEAYAKAQSDYFSSKSAESKEVMISDFPEYGFNEYLQIGIETGIAGLFIFLTLLFFTFHRGIVSKQSGIIGGLISFLTFAFFSYPFSILPFGILFVFLLAAISSNANKNDKTRSSLSKKIILPSTIIVTILTSTLLYQGYFFIQSVKGWKNITNYTTFEQYSIFEKSYNHLNDQYYFLLAYSKYLSYNRMYKKSNEILDRAKRFSCDPFLYTLSGDNFKEMKQYTKAEESYLKAYRIVPNRIHPLYLLTKLYQEMSEIEKMKETAIIAINKKPKIESKKIDEMKKEMTDLLYNLKSKKN